MAEPPAPKAAKAAAIRKPKRRRKPAADPDADGFMIGTKKSRKQPEPPEDDSDNADLDDSYSDDPDEYAPDVYGYANDADANTNEGSDPDPDPDADVYEIPRQLPPKTKTRKIKRRVSTGRDTGPSRFDWLNRRGSRSNENDILLVFVISMVARTAFSIIAGLFGLFIFASAFGVFRYGPQILGLPLLAVAGIFIGDRFYRYRIKEEIEYNDGQIKKITWLPFHIAWFTAPWRSYRRTYFKVQYVDGNDRERTELCGISVFLGSEWESYS